MLKEFRVLLTCNVCGETFDSDYKLTKHMSKSHPQSFERAGWMGGDGSSSGEGEHSCSCGGSHYHHDRGHAPGQQ